MAFYKDDFKKKKTRTERLNEGGWEDEGTRYHNKATYGNKPDKTAAGPNTTRPSGNMGRAGFHPAANRGTQTPRGSYVRPATPIRGQHDSILQPDRRPFSRPVQGGKTEKSAAGPERNDALKQPAYQGRGNPPRSSQPDHRSSQRAENPSRGRYDQSEQPRKRFGPVPQQAIRTDDRTAMPDRRITLQPHLDSIKHLAPAGTAIINHQTDPEVNQLDNLLSGRNPIREAIKSGRDIEKLLVARGDLSGSAREIISMAHQAHIIVQEVDRVRLDEITPHHQGMLAFASAYQYSTLEAMLQEAEEKNEQPFLVILDGITDPHNLGAIIRTASCVGAHGVIVPERRAVGLTPAAVRASAGSIEYIKVARVSNITRVLERLKERGIWIFAADQEGKDYRSVDFSGPCALVIGSEGEGISRLVLDHSDHRVSIPMRSNVDSLNASVAAGVLLFAIQGKR